MVEENQKKCTVDIYSNASTIVFGCMTYKDPISPHRMTAEKSYKLSSKGEYLGLIYFKNLSINENVGKMSEQAQQQL